MSTEVELSTADTLTSLQSQLASAHEALAIAESTVTLWRNAATALLHGRTYDDRGKARATMLQLLREAETGAGELRRVREERDILKRALRDIDRHVVGACEAPFSDMPEPCEECGDMREIASQALALVKAVAK